MIKPSTWLQSQVKKYEELGATLVGYGIPRNDIDYEKDFPKCLYAILEIPSSKILFVCEEEYYDFHDGWFKYPLDGHCWWEEGMLEKLNFKSFNLIKVEGFWL